MAHTKSKGTTKLGRDSEGKRLGVKIYGGQPAKTGNIIIRQRGTKFIAGKNVRRGNDDTLYASTNGLVKFFTKRIIKFNGTRKISKVVTIE